MKRSSTYNIICAICAGIAAVLFQVLFCFVRSMAVQMVLLVVTSVLFLIPFVINLRVIKGYYIDRLSRFILGDFLCVILPAAVMSAVTELVISPFSEVRITDGIGSLILIAIVLLEALIFWIAYFIANKIS